MNSPNINYLWSELILAELVRSGVTQFVISPGSRNSPLVVAAAQNAQAQTLVHPDERGAAFYALGYGRATGKPPALISTSGTATANYFPAIVEASLSAVPLVVLTADRPIELRDAGAPQTMNQIDLYGNTVRWSYDLPAPTTEIPPQFVLTTIDQLIYRSLRPPAGPVHLNCQFREPLAPTTTGTDFSAYLAVLHDWRAQEKCYTEYTTGKPESATAQIEAVIQEIFRAKNGLLIAGPMNSFARCAEILQVAEQLGMPALLDVASGLRFGTAAGQRLIHYDYYLRSPKVIERIHPDLILHFGALPRSRTLQTFLQQSRTRYIQVSDTPFRQDPFHLVTTRVEMAPVDFCRLIGEQLERATSGLLPIFQQAETIAAQWLASHLANQTDLFELAIVRLIQAELPAGNNLFLANSMTIRDADAAGVVRNEAITVGVNFGVNGIDGTLAAAAGFAAGNQRPTTVILGDLAFFHDLNSLQLVRQSAVPMVIVVLNNNGGGIFSFLPIAVEQKYFEAFFGTPQNLSFHSAAEMFELDYSQPGNRTEFHSVYRQAVATGRSAIIEVRTDRAANYAGHQLLWEKLKMAMAKELKL